MGIWVGFVAPRSLTREAERATNCRVPSDSKGQSGFLSHLGLPGEPCPLAGQHGDRVNDGDH